MIRIAVSAQREFSLPADLPTTASYLRDLPRVLAALPHLQLVKTHGRDQYRILYAGAEGGFYHVAFYCDIQVQLDEATHTVRVTPLEGITPVPPRVTISSMTGHGYYSSQSVLRSAGARTDIRSDVEISAEIPKPLGLRMVPDQIVERVVERVMSQRIQEITDAFAQTARP